MTDRTFVLTIEAPPSGGTPTWVNSLTAGAQTILTPSGAGSIRDVTPEEWLTESSQTRQVVSAYSGGAGDPTNRLLYVHGGGHGDSKLNALYTFNFNGTTAPIGWQLTAAPSSLADATAGYSGGVGGQGADTLADGKPCAVHTYDQLWIDPTNNRFYRTHGSKSSGGGAATNLTWYWNGTQWINPGVAHNAPLGGDLDWVSVSNPAARKTMLARVDKAYFYRWDSGWSALKTVGGTGNLGRAGNLIARHDGSTHANNRYTEALAMSMVGLGSTFPKATIDWTAETVSTSTTGLTSANTAGLFPTGFYEALTDSYWLIMPVSADGVVPMSGLYWQVNASTFAVTTRGSGTLDAYPTGTAVHHYNRLCFVPEWRTVVYCTDQGRVFALKLPT
jgi:hypothetical protein